MDEIIGYLLDDPNALKACSLTCKHLFGATRPIIHERVYLTSRPTWMERPKPKGSLFGLRRKGPETFERLVDADRAGLLRYVRYLTFKMGDGSFHPEYMKKYLPHLQSITDLHTLTLRPFRVRSFMPVFNECFGMFTNTLRHLDIRNAYGTDRQLLYIISQFLLLEDLTIVAPTAAVVFPEDPFPVNTRLPPLRGTLVLMQTDSRGLPGGFAALPGGPNCRSLELFLCIDSQVVLDACSHSVTSVSYLWGVWSGDEGEPNSRISRAYCDVTFWYDRNPAGSQTKCNTREVRIHRRAVQCLTCPRMDPPDAPYDNFTNVQRTRDLDPAHVVSMGSTVFDER